MLVSVSEWGVGGGGLELRHTRFGGSAELV